MFEPRDYETSFLYLLRIVARASDVVCLAIIILFFIAEDMMFGQVSLSEWAGLFFFPMGVFIGLVLAWHEELMGGLLIALSVTGFYVVYGWLLNSSIYQSWALLPFLVPGILFIAYGMARSSTRHIAAH